MPTPTKGPRLGGSAAHQKAMLSNLASALFEHGRIKTTEAKARRLRPVAEKLITKAKVGSLASRREVMKSIRDKDIVHILFAEIAPLFEDRNGGYIRIVKTLPRKGDNAPMAIVELIQDQLASTEAKNIVSAAAKTSNAKAKKDDNNVSAIKESDVKEKSDAEKEASKKSTTKKNTEAKTDSAKSRKTETEDKK